MPNKLFVSKNFNDKHKVVSVLFVVRDDIENLEKSIKSIFELSLFSGNIEVLIWFDEDDESYNNFVNSVFMDKYNIKVYVRKRVGYSNIFEMMNFLATMSSGDFILIFSSDIMFEHRYWDLELYKYNRDDILILRALVYHKDEGETFYDEVGPGIFVLTRRVYEILGRICPLGLADRYLFLLSCHCGISKQIYMPIIMYDYLFNLKYEVGRYEERQELWQKTNYSEEMIGHINEDIDSIKEYIESNNIEGRKIPYFHIRYYDHIFGNTDNNFSIEMFGGGVGKSYFVDFTDKSNNDIIFRAEISSGVWASVLTKYYIDWRINVYDEDVLIYTYDLDLEGRKVLIKIESDSMSDILEWIPYVEKFREKHKCHVFCSVMEPEKFENCYPDIEFIGIEEKIPHNIMTEEEFSMNYNKNNSGFLASNGVFIEYKIGKFGDAYDRFLHPEDYTNIPTGKIASNILGLKFSD